MGLVAILTGLMGSSCAKKTVHVEFINGNDQSIIAVSDMRPEQLPETFAVNTTLDMANKKWAVDSADPVNKFEFVKTGKLRVVLSPITIGVPGDILFSLATISDDIGNVQGDTLPSDRILALHEDDWRQIEFVSQKFAVEIDKECEDIRRIYSVEKVASGFKKVHIRKRIADPLQAINLTSTELESKIKPVRKYDGIGFQKTRGTITGGFAWEIPGGLIIWGVSDAGGNVTRLCLLGRPAAGSGALVAGPLTALAREHALNLVDWCRAAAVKPDTQAFMDYFGDNQ